MRSLYYEILRVYVSEVRLCFNSYELNIGYIHVCIYTLVQQNLNRYFHITNATRENNTRYSREHTVYLRENCSTFFEKSVFYISCYVTSGDLTSIWKICDEMMHRYILQRCLSLRIASGKIDEKSCLPLCYNATFLNGNNTTGQLVNTESSDNR